MKNPRFPAGPILLHAQLPVSTGLDDRQLGLTGPARLPCIARPCPEVPLLPPTRYRTIVADPPWPIKDSGPRTAAVGGRWDTSGAGVAGKRSVVPYERMSITEIAALPVRDLAEPNAHLYLWAVNAYLIEAYEVVRAWGFKPSTLLTWCKPPMGLGLGGTFVNTTEFVIFARRGSLPASRRVDSTWWRWPRPYLSQGPTHSAKPEAFTDMVEQVSPGPYVEMFARRARFGWDYWGDQSLGTAAVGGACADR